MVNVPASKNCICSLPSIFTYSYWILAIMRRVWCSWLKQFRKATMVDALKELKDAKHYNDMHMQCQQFAFPNSSCLWFTQSSVLVHDIYFWWATNPLLGTLVQSSLYLNFSHCLRLFAMITITTSYIQLIKKKLQWFKLFLFGRDPSSGIVYALTRLPTFYIFHYQLLLL